MTCLLPLSSHYLSLKSLTVNNPGERTFGVLTKLDLMDKGTNALDVIFLSPSSMFPVLLLMLYTLKFLKVLAVPRITI